ncbi:MAG: dTDP-glucose 4,6-dehydratase 2 [bacterium]|nr:dTDP-glucose 4,6-dehydratase 2 [bacterium]
MNSTTPAGRKKILVTGGAGFIGSNFVHLLVGDHPDWEVVVLDKLTYAGNLGNFPPGFWDRPGVSFVQGDICDAALVAEVMKDCTYVVHFAAETHVDRSIVDAGSFIETDVKGTWVLLEAARKNQALERFVHISTDEVYGEAPGRPNVEGDDLRPKSPYAASKAGADRLAFSYFTTYGLPVVISRCSNNFGPFQYPEKLIPLFVTNALEDKPLPIYGTGKNTRDWIYVTDHCDAILTMLKAPGVDGEVFNVSAATEHSVLDITDIILETLGKPKDLIRYVDDRPGHVERHAVSARKLYDQTGWMPNRDFKVALTDTVRWYQENAEWWQALKAKSAEYQRWIQQQYGAAVQ